MNFKKPVLTATQQLVLNGLLSLLGAAIAATATGTIQYYEASKTLNIGGLISFALVMFLGLFGKSLYDFVPAHITQEMQALRDVYVSMSAAQPATVAAPTQQPVQVTIHNNAAQSPAATTVASTTQSIQTPSLVSTANMVSPSAIIDGTKINPINLKVPAYAMSPAAPNWDPANSDTMTKFAAATGQTL
jgi:hypothetical protein